MRARTVPRLVLAATAAVLASSAAAEAAEVSARLRTLLEAAPAERHAAWVFFADKGPRAGERLAEGLAWLTPRALSRRERRGVRGAGPDLADLPVASAYLQAVASRVSGLRHVSRWFNAVSVDATAAELAAVAELPFVARLDRVARFRRGPSRPGGGGPRAASRDAAAGHLIDYGPGLAQVEQIGVPAVHDLGVHGQDVVIAVLDSGFDNLAHEAFSAASIVSAWDFVNGDPDVADGADMGTGSHGTAVLSVVGGYAPGSRVGPAFAEDHRVGRLVDRVGDRRAGIAVGGDGGLQGGASIGLLVVNSVVHVDIRDIEAEFLPHARLTSRGVEAGGDGLDLNRLRRAERGLRKGPRFGDKRDRGARPEEGAGAYVGPRGDAGEIVRRRVVIVFDQLPTAHQRLEDQLVARPIRSRPHGAPRVDDEVFQWVDGIAQEVVVVGDFGPYGGKQGDAAGFYPFHPVIGGEAVSDAHIRADVLIRGVLAVRGGRAREGGEA